ncbi:MAG: hypothetical protein MJZ11_12410 [Lachnospiraceae bacterium]|nr:hypothetical protein [Lachnospiraceae bacterium]
MEKIFEHIPHVERYIYERSFINEISILFTYKQLELDFDQKVAPVIEGLDLEIVSDLSKHVPIMIKDQDAMIMLTNSAAVVSLSTKTYKDFRNSGLIWDHVEKLLSAMKVSESVWSFTKGNRWAFNKKFQSEKQREVMRVVLSDDLINSSHNSSLYVEESDDKSHVFSCRYSMGELQNGNSHLDMKIMIVSNLYKVENLKKQVFEMNDLIFDCWSWCISERMKCFMKGNQNDNR